MRAYVRRGEVGAGVKGSVRPRPREDPVGAVEDGALVGTCLADDSGDDGWVLVCDGLVAFW